MAPLSVCINSASNCEKFLKDRPILLKDHLLVRLKLKTPKSPQLNLFHLCNKFVTLHFNRSGLCFSSGSFEVSLLLNGTVCHFVGNFRELQLFLCIAIKIGCHTGIFTGKWHLVHCGICFSTYLQCQNCYISFLKLLCCCHKFFQFLTLFALVVQSHKLEPLIKMRDAFSCWYYGKDSLFCFFVFLEDNLEHFLLSIHIDMILKLCLCQSLLLPLI